MIAVLGFMRIGHFFSYFFILFTVPLAATAGEVDDNFPAGRWISEKKDTVVRIEPCGESLCAYLDWIHPEEQQLTPSGEPLCGQKVLWGFEQSRSKPDLWRGGRIYKADDDEEYAGRIRVVNTGVLSVRGFIGLPLLGKTYTLTRINETDPNYPTCR
ncbi:MAG: DUF2147 domain-containing protein [Pseudomonadales bacterium]|nr:DUF2147 domain-containing protein [Pseudomonadales bacterium]